MRPPGVLPLGVLPWPLESEGGQRGARAKYGHSLDFLVLEAVQSRDARSDILARSGQTADSGRPCRGLLEMRYAPT